MLGTDVANHNKLIAAIAHYKLVLLCHIHQAFGDQLQCNISFRMAKIVVDGFEKIDEEANYEYNITMKTEIKDLTNILLTSVGRRGYLVKYFKEALGSTGKVYVSNSSDISPAFNYADDSVVSPLIYDKGYIDFLLRYCKEKNIKAIISLFDIDLPILSKNKQRFKKKGIDVIVSDVEIIDICNDKWKTYNFFGRRIFSFFPIWSNKKMD